jgi:hypothetical protein
MQSDQPVPLHRQTLDVAANPGRRKILALAIASAFLPSLAHAATLPLARQLKVHGAVAFRDRALEARCEIGTKLFAALRESDASFAGAADSLAADAASGKYPDVESLEWRYGHASMRRCSHWSRPGIRHRDNQGQASVHHVGRRAHVSTDRGRKPIPERLGPQTRKAAAVSRARRHARTHEIFAGFEHGDRIQPTSVVAPAYAERWSLTRLFRPDCRLSFRSGATRRCGEYWQRFMVFREQSRARGLSKHSAIAVRAFPMFGNDDI